MISELGGINCCGYSLFELFFYFFVCRPPSDSSPSSLFLMFQSLFLCNIFDVSLVFAQATWAFDIQAPIRSQGARTSTTFSTVLSFSCISKREGNCAWSANGLVHTGVLNFFDLRCRLLVPCWTSLFPDFATVLDLQNLHIIRMLLCSLLLQINGGLSAALSLRRLRKKSLHWQIDTFELFPTIDEIEQTRGAVFETTNPSVFEVSCRIRWNIDRNLLSWRQIFPRARMMLDGSASRLIEAFVG